MNPAYKVIIQSVNSANPNDSVHVVANIPESFMYDTSANYDAPFSSGLTGNRLVDTLLSTTGTQMLIQAATAQVWMGSNQSELGLELEFQALSDPYLEVFQPITDLMKLVTPKEAEIGGVLRSPGPRVDSLIKSLIAGGYERASSAFSSDTDTAEERVSMVNPATTYSAGDNSQESVSSTVRGLGNTLSVENLKKNIDNQISIQVGGFAFFSSVVVTNVQKTYQSAVDAISGLPFQARVSLRFKPLFMVIDKDLPSMFPTHNAASNRPEVSSTSLPPQFGGGAQSFPVTTPGQAVPEFGEAETFPVDLT